MKWRGDNIYFLTGAGLIKIGCSVQPAERVRWSTGWSPVPVELLAHVPGTPDDERHLHTVFLPHRAHHEWFRPSPELLTLIEYAKRTGTLPVEFRATGRTKNPFPKPPRTAEQKARTSAALLQTWQRKRERASVRPVSP
jgi:hypothetical protein